MATIRKSLTEVRSKPFRFSREERARLDAMSDEEVERNALDDPDNPPSTEEELERGVFGRRVRLLRERLGLSQAGFAERFRLPLGSLRDWEQGRRMPDSAMRAYLTVIEHDAEAVRRALEHMTG